MEVYGRVVAVCTGATAVGPDDSVVISQPAPTSFIRVSTFDAKVANQSIANRRRLSGESGDDEAIADSSSIALAAGPSVEPDIGGCELIWEKPLVRP